jgi:hypothetical protein
MKSFNRYKRTHCNGNIIIGSGRGRNRIRIWIVNCILCLGKDLIKTFWILVILIIIKILILISVRLRKGLLNSLLNRLLVY